MARKGKIEIRREMCKGCYLCIRVCPQQVLATDKSAAAMGVYPAAVIDGDKCTGCGGCYAVCPDMCITVYQREEAV